MPFAAGGIKPGHLMLYWTYTHGESEGNVWPVEVFTDASRKRRGICSARSIEMRGDAHEGHPDLALRAIPRGGARHP